MSQCPANLRSLESRRMGKGDKAPVVAVAPDRLEIKGALAERLRAAAKQATARLGRRVTPQQYALAVL